MLAKNRILHVSISLTAMFVLMGIAYSAYKGHADDSDVNAILAAYQNLKNTAVDSCATCHKSGAGTGPLRLVVPQYQISPPDLPQYAEKSCQDKSAPEHRFNADYDHNGGRSSFAIVAIRVKPLPKGTRGFEWEKVRDQFVAEEKVVVFGALKNKKGS